MNKVLRLEKPRVQSQRLKLLSSQPKIKLRTPSLLKPFSVYRLCSCRDLVLFLSNMSRPCEIIVLHEMYMMM
jgi:hypothetical protein